MCNTFVVQNMISIKVEGVKADDEIDCDASCFYEDDEIGFWCQIRVFDPNIHHRHCNGYPDSQPRPRHAVHVEQSALSALRLAFQGLKGWTECLDNESLHNRGKGVKKTDRESWKTTTYVRTRIWKEKSELKHGPNWLWHRLKSWRRGAIQKPGKPSSLSWNEASYTLEMADFIWIRSLLVPDKLDSSSG